MKISVITASFNSEETIERTIQSVISQTWDDIEYIVIDGKSSDQTLKIIEKYHSHIAYFISEPDSGIYDAMNKGLKKATGDIVCYLNSDDIYSSVMVLEHVVNCFKKNQIDVIFGGVSFFRKNNPLKIKRVYKFDKFDASLFAYGWMPAHPATFIKRTLMIQNGLFDTEFKIAGDFDYLLRMFKNLKFSYECTENIFIHMQMGGASNKNLITKILLNKEILSSCKKNGIKTNLFKILLRYPKKFTETFIK